MRSAARRRKQQPVGHSARQAHTLWFVGWLFAYGDIHEELGAGLTLR